MTIRPEFKVLNGFYSEAPFDRFDDKISLSHAVENISNLQKVGSPILRVNKFVKLN